MDAVVALIGDIKKAREAARLPAQGPRVLGTSIDLARQGQLARAPR